MLISRTLSPTSGYSSQYANAASMTNKGIELDGSFNVLSNQSSSLELNFNWATNENLVEDLAGTKVLNLAVGNVTSVALAPTTDENGNVTKYPIGTLWGTGSQTENGKWDGKLILNDIGFPQLTTSLIALGNPNPDWRGTIGLNARWNNFTFNMLFEHSQGGRYAPRTQWVLRRFGTTTDTDNEVTLTKDLVNVKGVTVPAGTTVRGFIHDFGGGEVLLDEAWFRQSIGGGFGNNQAYNFATKDATFSRIRELSLSYLLNNEALMASTGLSNVTFTATARNLFAWYKELVGVDPGVHVGGIQTGSGLDYFQNPSTKSFLFSVSANF